MSVSSLVQFLRYIALFRTLEKQRKKEKEDVQHITKLAALLKTLSSNLEAIFLCSLTPSGPANGRCCFFSASVLC